MIETWYNQDLSNPVKVQYLAGNVFSQDNNGNLIGVNVYQDGQPATLSGSVSASVIRADGATVAVTGSLSGNQCSVVLPQACYAVPGVLSIVIKLTSGETVTTVGAVVANVYQSATDTVVDPGTIIPDIATLVEEIEAAIASIPADYSGLWTSLAPEFSASKSYNDGDYVTYNGHLYRFFKAHSGTWNSNDVFIVTVGGEMNAVNKAFSALIGSRPLQISTTLTSTDGTVSFTGIKLFSGVKYRIICKQNSPVNFYVAGDSSNYTVLSEGVNEHTPNCDGYVRIYNGTAHYSGSFALDIYEDSLIVNGSKANVTTAAGLESITGGTKSCNDFPPNSIVCIGVTDDIGLLDSPSVSGNGHAGTYITFTHNGGIGSTDGKGQIYIGAYGNFCFRECWAGGTWKPWRATFATDKSYTTQEAWRADYPSDDVGYLPQMSSVCIASSVVNPGGAPKANFTGVILTIGYRSRTFYVEPGNFQIALGLDDMIYTRRYIYDAGGNYWGAWRSSTGESEYHVGTGYAYTSLTALLYALRNDNSQKVIYIHEGTYNIFTEYKAEITAGHLEDPPDTVQTGDYIQYSIFVPNNTRVIGLGDVVLNMTPEAADVSLGESYMWSPLNISGNVTLENLTVNGHNCRYCLHNDDHGAVINAHQHYKNCRFRYTYGDQKNGERLGYSNTIGFGLGEGCTHTFDDCEISYIGEGGRSAYYGHERNDGKNGTLILRNCIIKTSDFDSDWTVRFQTLGTSAGHVKAYFENCYINGHLMLDLYNSASRNNFEVTFVNCNKVPVIRNRTSAPSVPVVDPYTVRWFNPLPTPTAQDPQIDTDSI